MNKIRNAGLLCLLMAGATFAGVTTAQEDTARETMHKGQDAMQHADQEMQAGEMPAMSAHDQAMMEAWQKAGTPGAEHQRLIDGMVGHWNTKTTMWMKPDAPPMVSMGSAVNTAVLDGRYVRMDFTGDMMGQQFQGVGYTGYDNVTDKYLGTWMDSMSTGIYLSKGEYDPETKTYTYHGKMADPMNPEHGIEIRQAVHVVDADHHVMEWYETQDGAERKTMQIDFTRAD